jgi:hypothetical protein
VADSIRWRGGARSNYRAGRALVFLGPGSSTIDVFPKNQATQRRESAIVLDGKPFEVPFHLDWSAHRNDLAIVLGTVFRSVHYFFGSWHVG